VTAPANPLAGLGDGQVTELFGVAAVVIDQTTRQHRPRATVVLETVDGDVTVLVYPNAYERLLPGALRAGTRWCVTGRVDLRNDEPRLMAVQLEPLL
jgi:hypothetical protein